MASLVRGTSRDFLGFRAPYECCRQFWRAWGGGSRGGAEFVGVSRGRVPRGVQGAWLAYPCGILIDGEGLSNFRKGSARKFGREGVCLFLVVNPPRCQPPFREQRFMMHVSVMSRRGHVAESEKLKSSILKNNGKTGKIRWF